MSVTHVASGLTRRIGAATLRPMDPRSAAPLEPDEAAIAPTPDPDLPSESTHDVEPDAGASAIPSLRDLPFAGLTRRRTAFGLAVVVSAWIVIVFARQVGEAQAATLRADQLATENASLASQVEDLADELDLVQREAFIRQEARAYRLGGSDEVAFRLEADAPALPPDAPGSAAVRLGAATRASSPLESWLSLLFGPTPGG